MWKARFAPVAMVMDRVGRDTAVVDSVAEDTTEQRYNSEHRGVFVATGVQLHCPLVDFVAVDLAHGLVAEAWPDVLGDQVLVVLQGEFVDVEGGPPLWQPIAERGLGEGRVMVRMAALVDFDRSGSVLRGGEGGEPALRRH
jgi:hypothetical protein